jgi:hypothetical protein
LLLNPLTQLRRDFVKYLTHARMVLSKFWNCERQLPAERNVNANLSDR